MPKDLESVSEETFDRVYAIDGSRTKYLLEVIDEINEFKLESFTPLLGELDAVMRSIQIAEPTSIESDDIDESGGRQLVLY